MLTTEKVVKAFPHNHPESMKFDPETGKKLWEIKDVPVKGYDEDDCVFHGYQIVHTTDRRETIIAYLAIGDHTNSNGGADYQMEKLSGKEDISKIKEEMKELLEPLGAWDEKKFGLYAVLSCSY